MSDRGRSKNSILKALPDFRSGVDRTTKPATRRERGQRARRNQRFLVGSLTLAVLAVSLWFIFATRITGVQVSVAEQSVGSFVPIDVASVNQSAEDYLRASFINNWFINESKLRQEILDDNQAVSDVRVVSTGAKQLSIEVTARRRAVIWQKDAVFYEVDTSGTAFQIIDDANQDGAVLVVDKTRIPVELGQSVATPAFMRHVESLSELDDANDAFAIKQYIAPEAAREIHMTVVDAPYQIKASLEMSPEVITASLRDSLSYFRANSIVPKTVLDLRVAGRAVYQ